MGLFFSWAWITSATHTHCEQWRAAAEFDWDFAHHYHYHHPWWAFFFWATEITNAHLLFESAFTCILLVWLVAPAQTRAAVTPVYFSSLPSSYSDETPWPPPHKYEKKFTVFAPTATLFRLHLSPLETGHAQPAHASRLSPLTRLLATRISLCIATEKSVH